MLLFVTLVVFVAIIVVSLSIMMIRVRHNVGKKLQLMSVSLLLLMP